MATAPPQPGSIEFLHHIVHECTAPGKVSVFKGPATGVISESDKTNLQRLPIMFRCVLPQINESRHAIILVRPEIDCFQLDNVINEAFNINNRINGTFGKIKGFHPVWANGHTPPAAEIDTFSKVLRVMGEKKNGFMEVEAVQLTCEHCDQTERDKLRRVAIPDVGLRFMCLACVGKYYDLVGCNWNSGAGH